jgi:predicted MFS family arabinose efflux permease
LSSHSPATTDSTSQQKQQQRQSPLRHNRDFLLIIGGQMVSEAGTQVSHLAFPLLMLLLTNSPSQAGLMGALRAVPYVALALPAGALVDRWNRRVVMVVCDTGRALCLGSVAVALALHTLVPGQLYVIALIEGILGVVVELAYVACLPRVVPAEQFPQATTWESTLNGAASLAGPPLGGLLYAINVALPFIADAVSYAVSVVAMLCVRTPLQETRSAPREPMTREIRTGLVWLWRQPAIRMLALLSGLLNVVAPEASALLVIVLAQRQHASSAVIGLIFAGIGIGYIVGSLLTEVIRRRFAFRQILTGTGWLFVLFWCAFALGINNLALLAVVSLLFAITDPIYDITQFSYRMVLIPDVLQGRVNSAYRVIARATPPLGLALMGILLQHTSALTTIALLAVFPLTMAILATTSRAIRAAPKPTTPH